MHSSSHAFVFCLSSLKDLTKQYRGCNKRDFDDCKEGMPVDSFGFGRTYWDLRSDADGVLSLMSARETEACSGDGFRYSYSAGVVSGTVLFRPRLAAFRVVRQLTSTSRSCVGVWQAEHSAWCEKAEKSSSSGVRLASIYTEQMGLFSK